MDMIAIRLVRKWAVEVNGPPLLEFVTYRYGRHSYVFCCTRLFGIWLRRVSRMSNPGATYRTPEEVRRNKAREQAGYCTRDR
jgi:TPP-dependent pyruvate/acetoin dehydrogenase alpha subunit